MEFIIKSLHTFFVFVLFFLGNQTGLASEVIVAILPPIAFEKEHIADARMQAKRAGWTAETIDAQLRQSGGYTHFQPVRMAAVKAVLIGGDELIGQALLDLNTALAVSADTHEPREWFQLIQSVDCLYALPEVLLSDAPARKEMQHRVWDYVQSLKKISLDQFDRKEKALHQAACLYGAMVTSDHQDSKRWLIGDENLPPLWKTLREAVPIEGFIEDRAYVGYLYTVLHAVQYAFKDERESIQPWIDRHVDFFCRIFLSMMNQMNPNAGSILLQEPDAYWFISALERSAHQFNHAASQRVLRHIYEHHPRRADMLLFGSANWDAANAANVEYESAVYPRNGMAFLHDKQDTSLQLIMNLGLENAGIDLLGLHQTMYPLKRRFMEFNTVVINQQLESMFAEVSAKNARVTSFVPFDGGGTFVSASASGLYGERANYADRPGLESPVSVFQRIVYVYAPYIIDWFRAAGGKTHDYMLQLMGPVQAKMGMDGEENITANQPDFPLSRYKNIAAAESIVSSRVKGVYGVEAASYDKPDHYERVSFVDPAGATLFAAEDEDRSILINRKEFSETSANLFAVVRDYGTQDSMGELKIEPLALSPQPNANGFQAMAFVIKNGIQEDLFYSSVQPGQLYTTTYNGIDIELKGKFAHIQLADNQFKMMRYVGGSRLQFGKHVLQMDAPMTTGLIQNLDEQNGTFGVALPYDVPVGDQLAGHILQVVGTDPDAPFLQSLPLSHIERADGKPRYHLSQRINLSTPPKTLAAPVQNGDQVLYETFAEIKSNGEDKYQVTLSSPIKVSVPAVGNKKRFYVNEKKVRRLQGELQDGAIHVELSPNETRNGKIEVIRVP